MDRGTAGTIGIAEGASSGGEQAPCSLDQQLGARRTALAHESSLPEHTDLGAAAAGHAVPIEAAKPQANRGM